MTRLVVFGYRSGMDYTLRELECFLAVAEERSFTRAAGRLHLSQPPLSRHIRALEDKIGVALFVRTPTGAALTPAGRALYDESRDIPVRLARATEQARRCARGETIRLKLGFVSAVMNEALADTIRRFREVHPETEIMLHDLAPLEQLTQIADGRMDGGFVGPRPAKVPSGIRFKDWTREPLLALVPSDHPLSKRKTIRLSELRQQPFVAVSDESAPAFAELVRGHCRDAGFRPRIVLESPRAQAVALMVSAGSGVALLPAAAASLVKDSAVTLRLRERPWIPHAFAFRKDAPGLPVESLVCLIGS